MLANSLFKEGVGQLALSYNAGRGYKFSEGQFGNSHQNYKCLPIDSADLLE